MEHVTTRDSAWKDSSVRQKTLSKKAVIEISAFISFKTLIYWY